MKESQLGHTMTDQPDDDGLHETPKTAVALADGRTPQQAEAVRQAVEKAEAPDVRETWDVTSYHDSTGDVSMYRLLLEHEDRRVSIFTKELPNEARVSLRVAAELPGGVDEVHRDEIHADDADEDPVDVAVALTAYYAAMYDVAGEWPVGGDK